MTSILDETFVTLTVNLSAVTNDTLGPREYPHYRKYGTKTTLVYLPGDEEAFCFHKFTVEFEQNLTVNLKLTKNIKIHNLLRIYTFILRVFSAITCDAFVIAFVFHFNCIKFQGGISPSSLKRQWLESLKISIPQALPH